MCQPSPLPWDPWEFFSRTIILVVNRSFVLWACCSHHYGWLAPLCMPQRLHPRRWRERCDGNWGNWDNWDHWNHTRESLHLGRFVSARDMGITLVPPHPCRTEASKYCPTTMACSHLVSFWYWIDVEDGCRMMGDDGRLCCSGDSVGQISVAVAVGRL